MVRASNREKDRATDFEKMIKIYTCDRKTIHS